MNIIDEYNGDGGYYREGGEKAVNMNDDEIRTQVELFGSLAATHKEMANWFEVSEKTIENYMAAKGDFYITYHKALAGTKQSLRRLQLSKAGMGDSTMLIWLGKQLLGQKDKQDVTSDDKPLQTVFTLKIGDD